MGFSILHSAKKRIKQARHDLRNAYVRRFLAFTPQQLLTTIRQLGIEPGDIVCAHSSFDQFLGFQGNVGDALNVLKEAVGPGGGLMMPTQPFAGSAVDYVRKTAVTNIARAPSLMGMITEVLRRTPGAKRSIHPTHPVALWGERGLRLAGNDWEARTPCGRQTAYHRLMENDGKILMLGTGLQPMTFFHCVEELIEPWMPFTPFTKEEFEMKTVDAQGTVYETRLRLFDQQLSSRRRMAPMIPFLQKRGYWREAKIGRLQIICVTASNVFETVESMARDGRYCYE